MPLQLSQSKHLLSFQEFRLIGLGMHQFLSVSHATYYTLFRQ